MVAKHISGAARFRVAGRRTLSWLGLLSAIWLLVSTVRAEERQRTYTNRLVPIDEPRPLLADYPEFVEPVRETARFEAPMLIDDEGADLSVRAWRFSYNARGIIEIPNHLRGDQTALIVVHPWGIDDGQGWSTPEPSGCAFQCTPAKNQIYHNHVRKVVGPLVRSLRDKVGLVMYSLPGSEDPIRKTLYRSFRGRPTEQQRRRGRKELSAKLRSFKYQGEALPDRLSLSARAPAVNYFRQLPGLDAGPRYNNAGFWKLPIPVVKGIDVAPDDVVIYDAEGYEPLRTFLRKQGIRHVLLAGYNTDMCVISTTAGYKNLRQDFDILLIGDATIATFPANPTPAAATNAAVSFASLNLLITQVSWIRTVTSEKTVGQAAQSAGDGN